MHRITPHRMLLTFTQGSRMKVYSFRLNAKPVSDTLFLLAIRAVQAMVGAPDFDRKMFKPSLTLLPSLAAFAYLPDQPLIHLLTR